MNAGKVASIRAILCHKFRTELSNKRALLNLSLYTAMKYKGPIKSIVAPETPKMWMDKAESSLQHTARLRHFCASV